MYLQKCGNAGALSQWYRFEQWLPPDLGYNQSHVLASISMGDNFDMEGECLLQLRQLLTLKVPNKIAADDILTFLLYLSRKIRLDFSCESSHLKHQVLFSLKNNEKILMNIVCCSSDWRFKG